MDAHKGVYVVGKNQLLRATQHKVERQAKLRKRFLSPRENVHVTLTQICHTQHLSLIHI